MLWVTGIVVDDEDVDGKLREGRNWRLNTPTENCCCAGSAGSAGIVQNRVHQEGAEWAHECSQLSARP